MNDASFVAEHPAGALLTVWVVPGASRTEVVGVHGDAIKVRVVARAEGGEANRAVRSLLEDVLGRNVEHVGGGTSRRKQFLVPGAAPVAVASAFRRDPSGHR